MVNYEPSICLNNIAYPSVQLTHFLPPLNSGHAATLPGFLAIFAQLYGPIKKCRKKFYNINLSYNRREKCLVLPKKKSESLASLVFDVEAFICSMVCSKWALWGKKCREKGFFWFMLYHGRNSLVFLIFHFSDNVKCIYNISGKKWHKKNNNCCFFFIHKPSIHSKVAAVFKGP